MYQLRCKRLLENNNFSDQKFSRTSAIMFWGEHKSPKRNDDYCLASFLEELNLFHSTIFFHRWWDYAELKKFNPVRKQFKKCYLIKKPSGFIEEYHEFASWGLSPPKLTIPLNDSYISFYEVMSYVTHRKYTIFELNRSEINIFQYQ